MVLEVDVVFVVIVRLSLSKQRATGFDVLVSLLSMEDYYILHPPRIEEVIRAVVDY